MFSGSSLGKIAAVAIVAAAVGFGIGRLTDSGPDSQGHEPEAEPAGRQKADKQTAPTPSPGTVDTSTPAEARIADLRTLLKRAESVKAGFYPQMELAMMLMQQGESAEARELLEELAFAPDMPENHWRGALNRLVSALHQSGEAKSRLETLSVRDPAHLGLRKLMLLGRLQELLGQHDAATETWRTLLANHPDEWVARMGLVDALLRQEKRDEARKLAEDAPVDVNTARLFMRLAQMYQQAEQQEPVRSLGQKLAAIAAEEASREPAALNAAAIENMFRTAARIRMMGGDIAGAMTTLDQGAQTLTRDVDKQRMQLLKVSMLMDHRHLSRARELMDSLQVAEIAPANRSLVTRLRTRLQGMTEAEASEREAQRQSQSDAEAPPRRPAQATTPAQSAE